MALQRLRSVWQPGPAELVLANVRGGGEHDLGCRCAQCSRQLQSTLPQLHRSTSSLVAAAPGEQLQILVTCLTRAHLCAPNPSLMQLVSPFGKSVLRAAALCVRCFGMS